jgi:hypothetical protein
MSPEADKLRLAIAVFYDSQRLVDAVFEFCALGLTVDDLWLAGRRAFFEAGSELRQLLLSDGGGLNLTEERITKIGGRLDAAGLWGTDGPLQELLLEPKPSTGAHWFEKLFVGAGGPKLLNHAEKGAIIIAAKGTTPAVHDRCVRILLRHSLHTVHSQECRQDFGC